MFDGPRVHVRPAGETEEVRANVPVSPFTGATVMVEMAAAPARTVALVGLAIRVKSGEIVPSDITLTVLVPLFATKTSPLPLSYATPRGSRPTGMVATTLLDESEITLTVPSRSFMTKTSPLPLSYATPAGPKTMGIVVTTVIVTSEISLHVQATPT